MTDLRAIVGNNIKHLREEVHHLKQTELATAAGVSEKTMVSIEKGHAATNLDVLQKLAHQLGTSPAALTTSDAALRDLLALWPDLDHDGRADVLSTARAVLKHAPQKVTKDTRGAG